jgi:hypothetical protein
MAAELETIPYESRSLYREPGWNGRWLSRRST